MNDLPSPAGPRFHDVSPVLAVANLQRALDFYLQSLGFTKSWDCDKARQAAVARDQVELILAERRDPYPGAVYILVDEIETLYRLFGAAGYGPIETVQQRVRDGRVRDS